MFGFFMRAPEQASTGFMNLNSYTSEGTASKFWITPANAGLDDNITTSTSSALGPGEVSQFLTGRGLSTPIPDYAIALVSGVVKARCNDNGGGVTESLSYWTPNTSFFNGTTFNPTDLGVTEAAIDTTVLLNTVTQAEWKAATFGCAWEAKRQSGSFSSVTVDHLQFNITYEF